MLKGFTNSNSIKKSKKKPSWDNTISDLNAYKLSPEEMLQRKLDHISKNQQVCFQNNNNFASKTDSVYDKLTKIRYGNQLKENEANQRKKIVSNMFTSEKELFELFEQSEKALSTVESLFGDPLKKYKVNPVVTPRPNFNSINKNGNTNKSNTCALNECSDTENENSKSEVKSISTHQSNDKDDELSKFRKFIENERQLEQNFEIQKNSASTVSFNEMNIKRDATTETSPIDETNIILRYICERLVKNLSHSDSSILDCNKILADKVVDYMLKWNEKDSIKIQLLNEDLGKNKELIDALTLELIENNEKIKQMKNEYEIFTKNITTEISGLKSLFIKYLDQQVTSTIQSNVASNISNSSSKSGHQHYMEKLNFPIELSTKDQTETLLNQQLNSLQIEHKETQKRLKNLLKIQDSISQISGKGD